MYLRHTWDARLETLLHPWPVPLPADWLVRVNEPQTDAELGAVRRAVVRGSPFGGPAWQQNTARRLGLLATLRAPGRPKKAADTSEE